MSSSLVCNDGDQANFYTETAMHPHVSLPELCKPGVVTNHGADFKLRVEDVPVSKPGELPPPPRIIKEQT